MNNNKNSNKKEFTKFGKSSKEMLLHKEGFFQQNDEMLSIGSSMNKLYSTQPERLHCKNCNYKLGKADFKKLYVNYSICEKCGHLNGKNEDTDFFCSRVYTDNKGTDYSKVYNSQNREIYEKRTLDIYTPKAKFLKDAFLDNNIKSDYLKYADIGAGSGYFVSAMKNEGINNINGYEVSEQQVSLGNSMIGEDLLIQMDIDDTAKLIESIDADVISMIGVLEHVQHPRAVLKALAANKNIKFFYISVPLFSMSVFF